MDSSSLRRHQFLGRSINLPADLTEAQLDGRSCVRCGAKDQPMRPVGAWSEQSAQLFECVNRTACDERAHQCGKS
jgi:Zn ribbon nucleic-acid-binding protein